MPFFGPSIVSLSLSLFSFCQIAATAWSRLMTINFTVVHFAARSSVHVAYAHTGCPSPSKILVPPWKFDVGGALFYF